MTAPRDTSQEQGRRAEEVASWYFRLNGFLSIPGFCLHSDEPASLITEADLLAVRFPYSSELIREVRMIDDRWVSQATNTRRTVFAIVEVTTADCKVNPNWLRPQKGAMEKVIRRLGFAPDGMTTSIAGAMYKKLHWEDDEFVLQFVSIGRQKGSELQRYRDVIQLTYPQIAAFLWERFQGFGHLKGRPRQWPAFARKFADAVANAQINSMGSASEFVQNYIDHEVA